MGVEMKNKTQTNQDAGRETVSLAATSSKLMPVEKMTVSGIVLDFQRTETEMTGERAAKPRLPCTHQKFPMCFLKLYECYHGCYMKKIRLSDYIIFLVQLVRFLGLNPNYFQVSTLRTVLII